MKPSAIALLFAVIIAACSAAPAPSMTTPRWTFALRPPHNAMPIGISADVAIAGGHDGVIAFDTHTGAILWRRPGQHYVAFIDGDRVYTNDGAAIVAIAARSGSTIWRSAVICPSVDYSVSPAVLYATVDSVYAGCDRRLSRLRRRSGTLAASGDPLPVYRYDRIEPAAADALVVTGASDGAALAEHLTIVRPDTLVPIMDQRQDTTYLGTLAGEAILDDWCCNGRPDVYDPATIVHVSLTTGQESPPVDLRPDPQLFPADKRPIGQGATAALIDGHLYLAVAPMLYDYGNPLIMPQTPKRLLDNLADVPAFIGPLMFASLRKQDGSVLDEVLEMRGANLKARWQRPRGAQSIPFYDPSLSGVFALTEYYAGGFSYTVVMRHSDGAQMLVENCGPFVSDGTNVFEYCRNNVRADEQYLRMYTFPALGK